MGLSAVEQGGAPACDRILLSVCGDAVNERYARRRGLQHRRAELGGRNGQRGEGFEEEREEERLS